MNMTDRSSQYSCVLSWCWDSVSLIPFLALIRRDESSCCVTSMSLWCFPSWLVSPAPDYPPPCFLSSPVYCLNVICIFLVVVFFLLPAFLVFATRTAFLLKLAFWVLLFIYFYFFATIGTAAFTSLHRGPWDPGSWHCRGICFQTADEKNCLHISSLSASLLCSQSQITCEDANWEFSASLNHFSHLFVTYIAVWIWSQLDLIYLFEKFNIKMSW